MGPHPMFNDDTVAGSFVKKPDETVLEALMRARSRYEPAQAPPEAGPETVPEPPTAYQQPPAGQAERRATPRFTRSGQQEDQITDPAVLEKDVMAVNLSIIDLKDELAKRPESDPMGRSEIYGRLKANEESLALLNKRREEIAAGIPPKPVEMKEVESGIKKTPQEISLEKQRAERGAVPREGEAEEVTEPPVSDRTRIVREISDLRDTAPRPLKKMFGKNPTPEQVAKHKKLTQVYLNKMGKLQNKLKKATAAEEEAPAPPKGKAVPLKDRIGPVARHILGKSGKGRVYISDEDYRGQQIKENGLSQYFTRLPGNKEKFMKADAIFAEISDVTGIPITSLSELTERLLLEKERQKQGVAQTGKSAEEFAEANAPTEEQIAKIEAEAEKRRAEEAAVKAKEDAEKQAELDEERAAIQEADEMPAIPEAKDLGKKWVKISHKKDEIARYAFEGKTENESWGGMVLTDSGWSGWIQRPDVKGLSPTHVATSDKEIAPSEVAKMVEEQVGEAWPNREKDLPKRPGVTHDTTHFFSGLGRKAHFKGATEANAGVGIVVDDLTKPLMKEVAKATQTNKVFIDSGAFTAFTRGKEMDWPSVFARYQAVADDVATTGENLFVVAPDVIGDAAKTFVLQKKFTFALRKLAKTEANIIIPAQKGATPQEISKHYSQMDSALDTDNLILGIPANKQAWSPAEARAIIEAVNPNAVHLLGLGPGNPRYFAFINEISKIGKKYEIYTDSVPTGIRDSSINERKKSLQEQAGEEVKAYDDTELFHDALGALTDKGILRFAEEAGFDDFGISPAEFLKDVKEGVVGEGDRYDWMMARADLGFAIDRVLRKVMGEEVKGKENAGYFRSKATYEHIKKQMERYGKPAEKAPAKPTATKEDFIKMGQQQRGKPEGAMRDVQDMIDSPAMNIAIENTGDLTHRMNDANTFEGAGYAYVRTKVKNSIDSLEGKWGMYPDYTDFAGDLEAGIKRMAKKKGIDPKQHKKDVYAALNKYADAHRALPAFNEAHRISRGAAIALGELRFDDALNNLKILDEHLGSREEWVKYAHEGLAEEAPKGQPFKLDTEEAPVAEEPLKPEMAGEQDELFPGERAKYRAPEKGPPAPPPEGGLFGEGGEGVESFNPEFDFRKKPQAPIDTDKPMKRSDIIKFIAEKFDIPIRVGRFRQALGIFKVKAEVIRTRYANDIEVAAHEIGHALHKFLWPEARTTSGNLAAGPLRAFQDELIPIATKPRAGGSKTAEGYAEFIRRYVVNPDEAKRVAPKFYKFFEEKLDANAPDVKAILLKVRADYARWLEQPPLARVMGAISNTPELKAKVSGGELYTALVDALYPLEQVVKEMAKVTKIDQVPTRWNAYKLAHLMAGWKGKADAWLEYKPFSFKTYKFSGAVKSYREIMLPIKENRDVFDAYLVSKRSLIVGQEKSGIFDSDARQVVEYGDQYYPEFKQAALDLKHYQNALLRYLYDGGVINGEQFLKMRESNEDYVPFYRVMDYEQSGAWGKTGFEVTRAPLHRFKGSWRDIVSPTESIIKNTYAFINAVEKNAVGKALVDLSRQAEGMGKFVEKIPADTQRIAVKDTELEDMLRKYGKWSETTQFTTTNQAIRETITETGEAGEAVPPDERGTRIMKVRAIEALKSRGYSEAESRTIVDRISRATNTTARNRIIERVVERATVRATVREFGIEIPEGLAYIYRPSKQTPRGNVITVMERGKANFYEVDPRIYKAFHALDRESANTIIKIMAIPSRLLRAGATLTPEFALGKNPLRDQFTAFINSKYGYKPHFDFPRGLFSAFNKDADYWRWKIGGGEHSAMVSMDRDYFDKTWQEVMAAHGMKANALFVITKPIDALRAVSEFTEAGTRIGEFKAALRKLGTSKEAIQEGAYAAREVTLPFSRMGAVTKSWNMITAFLNANIADLDKIQRQFKEYPQQTTLRLIASITIPSILLAWATHDDDDIKEVAQWQKDIFWIFPTGRVWTSGPWKGSQVLLRYPKPFILGTLFGSLPERITRYLLDKDPHALDGFMNSLVQGVVPPVMPTGIVPPIENWANKSMFTGRAIVPKAREGVLPEYQYQPYTTETAKKIGGLLAKLPGIQGTAFEQQIVSPAGIENLIRGYSGGLGMWALHAADKSLQLAGVVPKRVEPAKALSDYPFLKAFVVRYPTADTESIKRFFDDYNKADRNIKSAKLMYKRGEVKEGLEILQKEDIGKIEGVKTALTKAHRLVELVYENPNIKPEEKRRIIDKVYLDMTAIAKRGNDLLDQIKAARNE